MYNFEKELFSNEKIVCQGQSYSGKGKKNIGGLLLIVFFMLCIQILLIWSLITGTGDGAYGVNFNFIIIFMVTLLFQGIAVFGLVYNIFIKSKKIKGDCYCLTDSRILKYESKNNRIIYGYLENYDDIHYDSIKDGYGNLYIGITYSTTNDSKKDLKNILELAFNSDSENAPYIWLESVKDPIQLSLLVIKARDERRMILKNIK